MKHLIETTDLTDGEIEGILTLARELKRQKEPRTDLLNKSIALLFFNPSLRTRVSFVRAIEQLGGSALPIDVGQESWKIVTGESVVMNSDGVEHIKEAIPVLSRYCDFLGIRAFGEGKSHEVDRKEELIRTAATLSSVPFINLESAMAHPCQALADILTIAENRPKKPKVVLTWAPHPKRLPTAVPNSFLLLATRMGWDVTLLRPEGFDLDPEITQKAVSFTEKSGGTLQITNQRDEGFKGADVIYAKSWGSISGALDGMKHSDWTVTKKDMMKTNDSIFMHCLPVRRNVEVTDEVLDSGASRVVDEAENRLHVQKAILCFLHQQKEGKNI